MAKIVVVGEAWGRDEAAIKRHFVGATGRELNRLLEETGFLPPGSARRISPAYTNFLHHERDAIYEDAGIYLTNVFHFQPAGNRILDLCGPKWGALPPIRAGKYLRDEFVEELDRLKEELAGERPNLIIGLGATAAWFALGAGGIAKRRGTIFQSPYGKFIATYHPAYLLPGRMAEMRPVVIFDLIKARREAEFPEIRRPARKVYIPQSIDEIDQLLPRLAAATRLSIDIETAVRQITCIGFAWSPEEALVIPIFDYTKASKSYWGSLEIEIEVWKRIRALCELPVPKVFQNGLYDIRFLWESYGIAVVNAADDTMLLHHALQPEIQKGLGFLGSIYTNEASWKTMRSRAKSDTIKREDE